MKADIVFIQELKHVAFYTVQVINENNLLEASQFRDFKDRMSAGDAKDQRQLSEIERMINRIGETYGATEDQFRGEGIAVALPPHSYKFYDSDGVTDFGLRLYCIRVTDEIVILLNGARKTAQSPMNCENCRPHFEFANTVAGAFYDALRVGEIEIEGRELFFNIDYLNF